MSSLTRKSIPTSTSTAVLARIEAQDEGYVQPLREFLQASGCDVEVNLSARDTCTYWICVGDAEFVKSIIAQGVPHAQKYLSILYDGYMDRDQDTGHSMKIALVDPIPLDATKTRELFAFFFTGRAHTYNDRKGLGSSKPASVMPKQAAREPRAMPADPSIEDTTRVAQIMKQIFTQAVRGPGDSKKRRVRGISLLLIYVGRILALIAAPVIIYILAIMLGGTLLFFSSKALIAGNTTLANRLLEYSKGYTKSASVMLNAGAVILAPIGMQQFAQDQELILGVVTDVTKSEAGALRIIGSVKRLAVNVLDPSTAKTHTVGLSDVVALRSDVALVAQHLALIQAKLDSLLSSGRFPFYIPTVQTVGHQGLDAVISMRQMIEVTLRLLTLYPEVGGFKKPQTYLVLLQNSMEIRPTGGFIGSILLITFTDGTLSDMQVQDVYVADGQLKGHVDPPVQIREMLGQEHWYLRDSNWDPDFSKSAEQAAWFYEKEMGTTVDGVVGLSLPMVTRLLEVTGPLELSDFSERISASNFFVKSLLYTQANFFPGSTQKKDFLGSLTNALILRLTTDHTIQAGKLLSAILTSLDAKDVQFYFADQDLENIITQWDWAGGIAFPSCQPIYRDSECLGDGVGLVQANLGVNKVNYFMKQEALSLVRIQEDGTVSQELTVTMKNTSTGQDHDGGGTYQAYLRFLYPKGTELIELTIDGQTATPSSSVVTEETEQVVSVGVPMFVPPKSEHQIMVSTKRTQPLSFSPSGTYEFAIRKQAGVDSIPWHVIVEYPEVWRATADSDLAKPGSLQYNTDLSRDVLFKALFETTL